jgi:hypothetical protein
MRQIVCYRDVFHSRGRLFFSGLARLIDHEAYDNPGWWLRLSYGSEPGVLSCFPMEYI